MILKRSMDLSTVLLMINTALGLERPDLVVVNGDIVDVATGSIYHGHIVVKCGRIVSVTADQDVVDKSATNKVDASGHYVVPGFIDSHTHIESSMLTPSLFAYYLLREGITAAVVDPHEVGNVAGVQGIRALLRDMENTSFKFIPQLPPCIPPEPKFDESGGLITVSDLEKLLNELQEQIVGLGEVMSYLSVLRGEGDVLSKIALAHGRGALVDGHAADLTGRELHAYILPKIMTDHSARTDREMLERLRCGLYIQVQKRSFETNFESVVKLLSGISTQRAMWCTDDAEADEILASTNTVRSLAKEAIEMGLDPVKAVQMATVNAAQAYRVDTDIGIVAPSRYADLLVIKSLESLDLRTVVVNGEIFYHEGRVLLDPPRPHNALELFRETTIKVYRSIKPIELVPRANVQRGIAVVNTLTTNRTIEKERLLVKDGIVAPDPRKDISWISIVERHGGSNNVSTGLLKGCGIRDGALATSVSHDSHNILLIGVNLDDMYMAFEEVRKCGGGLVLVKNSEVISEVPLPYFGLLSSDVNLPYLLRRFKEKMCTLGVKVPLKKLLFLTLTVGRGGCAITSKGLVDYRSGRVVPVVEEVIEETYNCSTKPSS